MKANTGITFQGQTFKTKTAFSAHVKEKIQHLPQRVALTGQNHDFILELFHRHPTWEEKAGPSGVRHFVVVPNFGDGREIRLIRNDGSEDNVSHKKAVQGRDHVTSTRELVDAALRYAIIPQVYAFKDAEFEFGGPVRCAITGELVTETTCEVDHIIPFRNIRDSWFAQMGGIENIKTTAHANNPRVKAVLADPGQEQSWLQYHAAHATFQITTPEANRARQ